MNREQMPKNSFWLFFMLSFDLLKSSPLESETRYGECFRVFGRKGESQIESNRIQ